MCVSALQKQTPSEIPSHLEPSIASPAPSVLLSKNALFHRLLGYHEYHSSCRLVGGLRPPSTTREPAHCPAKDHSLSTRNALTVSHTCSSCYATLPPWSLSRRSWCWDAVRGDEGLWMGLRGWDEGFVGSWGHYTRTSPGSDRWSVGD